MKKRSKEAHDLYQDKINALVDKAAPILKEIAAILQANDAEFIIVSEPDAMVHFREVYTSRWSK